MNKMVILKDNIDCNLIPLFKTSNGHRINNANVKESRTKFNYENIIVNENIAFHFHFVFTIRRGTKRVFSIIYILTKMITIETH